MKTALFCLGLLTLPACTLFHTGQGSELASSAAPPAYERIAFTEAKASAEERAACEAAGGEVVSSGKLQWENCVQPFPDAGKVCSNETDCVGQCRYEGPVELEPGTETTGTCQATDARFGCNTVVEDGKISYTLCVD